jgi:beta-barrel assembly-enhancing protease
MTKFDYRKVRWWVALTAVAVIGIGVGCSFMQGVGHQIGGPVEGFINGITEVNDASHLGPKDEDELGKSVAILVTNTYPPTDNKKLVQYVNLVGYTLVSSSRKPDGRYVFGVLESDSIEAYSGPNGYVMITTGAIKNMRDEAELAGVLAHELTHVIDQHGLEAARAGATKAGLMDAAKSLLGPQNANKFIDYGIDTVVRNGYDKPQEDAADQGAVHLLIAAGYDPQSYANFLSHMAALQESQPRSTTQNAVADMSKAIMATHPGLADRYQLVTKEISLAGGSGGATMKERFRAYVFQ